MLWGVIRRSFQYDDWLYQPYHQEGVVVYEDQAAAEQAVDRLNAPYLEEHACGMDRYRLGTEQDREWSSSDAHALCNLLGIERLSIFHPDYEALENRGVGTVSCAQVSFSLQWLESLDQTTREKLARIVRRFLPYELVTFQTEAEFAAEQAAGETDPDGQD